MDVLSFMQLKKGDILNGIVRGIVLDKRYLVVGRASETDIICLAEGSGNTTYFNMHHNAGNLRLEKEATEETIGWAKELLEEYKHKLRI